MSKKLILCIEFDFEDDESEESIKEELEWFLYDHDLNKDYIKLYIQDV